MSKRTKKNLQRAISFSLFIFILVVYINNLTRDIYSGDIGDLVTAAFVFGVPHPPGYPLLTMLGAAFSHLPFPITPVTKVALVSVFSSMLALLLFFKFSLRETKSFFIAILSASVLAFSYIFWFFSEIPEVFALNNLFTVALFYFAIQFYEKRNNKFLYISSFLVGLSLTNQHQIILIFPSIILLLLPSLKKFIKDWSILFKSASLFILGLLPYLYVPLAASRDPVVNWNNPSNLENFLHLVLRQDYVTFSKGNLQFLERLPIFDVYFTSLLNNYSILIVLICICGFFFLLKNKKIKLASFILAFLISGPLFIFYIMPVIIDADMLGVIERLYAQSFIIFIFFLPYGFLSIHNLIKRVIPKKIDPKIFLLVFLIVPIQMFFYNFEKNNLSNTNIGDNLGYDLLSSLPQNAIILLHGDSNTFNAWYVHYVLGFRPDVTLVNNKGAGNDYFQQNLYDAFIKKNPNSNLGKEDVFRISLPEIIKKRPFFSTFYLENYDPDLFFIPKGIYYEVINRKNIPHKDEYLASVNKNIDKLHVPSREALRASEQNLITPSITRAYSFGLVNVGAFLNDYYQDSRSAIKFFENAVSIDNRYSTAYIRLGVSKLNYEKDCSSSIKNIKKGIELSPIYEPFYQTLRNVYITCSTNQEEMAKLRETYQALFRKELEEIPLSPSATPLQ